MARPISEESHRAAFRTKKKADLASLPAKVLLPILQYSLTSDLIDVCRSIWHKVPVYVPFAKSLAAMALYMKPQGVDKPLLDLMDGYWHIRKVPRPFCQQLDGFRFSTVCSSRSSAARFERIYLDIQTAFRHRPGGNGIKEPAWLDPYLRQGAPVGSDHESLYLRLLGNVEHQLCPESISGVVNVIHYQGLFNMGRLNSTSVIPDFAIRTPVTAGTARLINCLIRIHGMFILCDIDLLREAISSAIAQNMPKVLGALLGLQRHLVYPTAQKLIMLSWP